MNIVVIIKKVLYVTFKAKLTMVDEKNTPDEDEPNTDQPEETPVEKESTVEPVETTSTQSFKINKIWIWQGLVAIFVILLIASIWTGGFGLVGSAVQDPPSQQPPAVNRLGTYDVHENTICTEDGKPVVYLFSTTWCPHCTWITDTFNSVAQEYVDAGKIVAYHWEIDIGDDTLTDEVETEVPAEHMSIYRQFNPGGSIPTFVFGCQYSRIGNGHEQANDLAAEDAEFRQLFDKLIEETG